MCLIDHKLFRVCCNSPFENLFQSICPDELLDKNWEKDAAPNIQMLTRRYNSMSRFVQTLVLTEEQVETRATLVRYFIEVMKVCDDQTASPYGTDSAVKRVS